MEDTACVQLTCERVVVGEIAGAARVKGADKDVAVAVAVVTGVGLDLNRCIFLEIDLEQQREENEPPPRRAENLSIPSH